LAGLRPAIALVLLAGGQLVSATGAGPARGQGVALRRVESPNLGYVRLFGGARTEYGVSVAVGGTGNVFLAGTTTSPDWPVAWKVGCAQAPCPHAFLIKLRPDGTAAYFSLALGGSRTTEVGGLTVDAAGNAYLTGTTSSPDFPTVRAYQSRCGGSPGAACNDGFIAKVDSRGTLIYSSFLGGRGPDSPSSIALDRQGDIYVAGQTRSPDFPVTHALQPRLRGGADGFVTKLDPNGRRLLYSTYLGGTKDDRIAGIAVDRSGEAYVAGTTDSPDLRMSPHSVQRHFIGGDCTFYRCRDAFVIKLGTAGRFLTGTFLATPADDAANAITLDGAGNVYVAGSTGSARIPSVRAMPPLHKILCGSEGAVAPCESAYVVELARGLGRLLYSRILAGNGLDSANALAVNATGNVVVAGYTESSNFPTVSPVQAASGGGQCPEAKGNVVPCDGFVAVIGPLNSRVRFSTYLGGNEWDTITSLALNGHGTVFLAGTTMSTNFATTAALSLPKAFLGRIDALYR